MRPTPCGCTSARAVRTVFTKICGEFVGSQRADVGIGPYRPVSNIELKAIGKVTVLRPKRAFRPQSGQKIARVSAQYDASPAHLFAYFFWRNRKSRPSETQLRCHRKRDSSGETGKRTRSGGAGAERTRHGDT